MYLTRPSTCLVGLCLLVVAHAHSIARNPLNYLTTIENVRISTPSQRIHAHSSLDILFDLHDGEQTIKLRLSPNHNVIADGASVSYLAADGTERYAETLHRSEYRVFKGDAFLKHRPESEWTNVGWARIMVHQDGDVPIFEGAFRVDGDHHHVQTSAKFMQTKHALDPVPEMTGDDSQTMVVWRDSDMSQDFAQDGDGFVHGELRRSVGEQPSCSAERLSFNAQADHPVFAAMRPKRSTLGSISTRHLFGRQTDVQTGGNGAGVNLTTSIGSTAGCPQTRKVALVGVATDCSYTAAFNSTEAARANVISIVNTASVQYEDSFNITLGLLNLTMSDTACPSTASTAAAWNVGCSASTSIQDRLNLFSAWRGNHSDNNAYWTLMSTCATGDDVGLAWLGQACVNTAQVATSGSASETVSGTNVVVRTSSEWQVFAHETGHTFGAVHDCDATTCADGTTVQSQQCCPLSATVCDARGQYIMNPVTGTNLQRFSACTVGNICSAIGRNSVRTTCLSDNKDVVTLAGSQCGNGIVEAGEECDCGGVTGCGSDSCCDPTTCKFIRGAVCDPTNDHCCTGRCQFASNGTICRASAGVCDPQEVCSGTAAGCPADVTAPDGTSCGPSLTCTSGQCTSRDLQCKTIMGSYTQGNDTYACSSSGCQISCASPDFGPNVCYSMQQNFLDGTSCGGGGSCSNGFCEGQTTGGRIRSWVHDNKTLVIALAASLGSLLALTLLGCAWGCWRRRRSRRVFGGGSGKGQGMGMGMNGGAGPVMGNSSASASAFGSGAASMADQSRQHMSMSMQQQMPMPVQPPPTGWWGRPDTSRAYPQTEYPSEGGYGVWPPPPPAPPASSPRQAPPVRAPAWNGGQSMRYA